MTAPSLGTTIWTTSDPGTGVSVGVGVLVGGTAVGVAVSVGVGVLVGGTAVGVGTKVALGGTVGAADGATVLVGDGVLVGGCGAGSGIARVGAGVTLVLAGRWVVGDASAAATGVTGCDVAGGCGFTGVLANS